MCPVQLSPLGASSLQGGQEGGREGPSLGPVTKTRRIISFYHVFLVTTLISRCILTGVLSSVSPPATASHAQILHIVTSYRRGAAAVTCSRFAIFFFFFFSCLSVTSLTSLFFLFFPPFHLSSKLHCTGLCSLPLPVCIHAYHEGEGQRVNGGTLLTVTLKVATTFLWGREGRVTPASKPLPSLVLWMGFPGRLHCLRSAENGGGG